MYQRQLSILGHKLDALALSNPEAKKALEAVEPPKAARVNQAIMDLDFANHPDSGESYIVYPVSNLKAWFRQFSEWTSRSSQTLKSIL